MTRMTGPDCVVMCNLINTHTHISMSVVSSTLVHYEYCIKYWCTACIILLYIVSRDAGAAVQYSTVPVNTQIHPGDVELFGLASHSEHDVVRRVLHAVHLYLLRPHERCHLRGPRDETDKKTRNEVLRSREENCRRLGPRRGKQTARDRRKSGKASYKPDVCIRASLHNGKDTIA